MSKELQSPATPESRVVSYTNALRRARSAKNFHTSAIPFAQFGIKRDELIEIIAVKAAEVHDQMAEQVSQIEQEVARLAIENATVEDLIVKTSLLKYNSDQEKTEALAKLNEALQLNNQAIADYNEQIARLKDVQLRAESVFESAVSPTPQPEEKLTEVAIEPRTQDVVPDVLDQTKPTEEIESTAPATALVVDFLLTRKSTFTTDQVRQYLSERGVIIKNMSQVISKAVPVIMRKGYVLKRHGEHSSNRTFEVVELSGDERLFSILEARNVTLQSLEFIQAFLQLHKNAITALISTDEDGLTLQSCLETVSLALSMYQTQDLEPVQNIALTRNKAVKDMIACFKRDGELVEELKNSENSMLQAFGISLSLLHQLDILASTQRKVPYHSQSYSTQLLKYVADFEERQRTIRVSDQIVLAKEEVPTARDQTPVILDALTGQNSRKNPRSN